MHIRDQTGSLISLDQPAKRIVSLVPSQTELLADLALEIETVGITKFCNLPNSWFQSKTRVGGTKTLKLDVIRNLNPDLILANKEENDQEQIETLKKEFSVWTSDIRNRKEACDMIISVGELTNRVSESANLVQNIKSSFNSLGTFSDLSAIYFVWNDPMMVAGGDTFIHHMMQEAGFSNVVQQTRYPVISKEEIGSLKPAFILLPTEPFPFGEKHQKEYGNMFPDSQVVLVDGQMFSWYGSRMVHFAEYIHQWRQNMDKR